MPRRLSPDRSANASWERPAASRYCRSSTPNVTGLWSMLVLDDPAVGGDSTSAHSPTVLQPAPAVLCDHRSPRLAHEGLASRGWQWVLVVLLRCRIRSWSRRQP